MVLRTIDAYCPECAEPTSHEVRHDDPGSCRCGQCGHVQPLMVPMASLDEAALVS